MAVLVVADDSTTIQKVVELSFVDAEMRVQCFEDGLSALEYLKSHPSSIVLADISLPLLNGYELCRELNRDARTASIPVVLLSGTFEPFDVKLAEEVGYSGCLTKPFETSQLVELVESLLQRPADETISSPPANLRSTAEAKPEVEPVLFRPALRRHPEESLLFFLAENQCAPAFAPLKRQFRRPPVSQPDLSSEQVDELVRKVMGQLPETLRELIPEVAREVLRDHR